MFYTGIGSRETPKDIIDLMITIAGELASDGYTLRSGGAAGADTAFENGCDAVNGKKEIYLPWKRFNKNPSKLYKIPPNVYKIAEMVYRAKWNRLAGSVQALMARNIQQVSGKDADIHVAFVLCWTPDGCETVIHRRKSTGGTGQAIAYADAIRIPVINLANEGALKKLKKQKELIGAIKW